MDLVQELERAIPSGPPLPPPEARTASGRRALRRRRALQGLAAAGAVAALGLPVALASGGPATRGHDPAPPATQPSEGRASDPAAPGRERRAPARERNPAASYPWGPGEVAAAVPGDGLLLRPGATVLERRDDLYPGKDTESVALRLRFRGLEHWAALEWDQGGSSGVIGSPRHPFYGDFEDFVAKATSDGGMTHGPPPGSRGPYGGAAPRPVDVAGLRWDGERIVVDGPGRVLERRGDVDLTDAFAGPDDPTGAALVELPDATRVLVLYREAGGEGQLIAVTADGEGRTLADQLAWARGRYRSGAGLL